MLCVPAEAPDGTNRGSARAQTHKHKTKWKVCTEMEGVHQTSLNSTPGACKCTRRHDQHTEGGRFYSVGGLCSAVLI